MHPRESIKWRNRSCTYSQAYGSIAYKILQAANKERKSCCELPARKQKGQLWFRNSMRVLGFTGDEFSIQWLKSKPEEQ